MPRALIAALLGSLMLCFAGTPTALADVRDSANWSGYAIHRPGVRFTDVSASWTQPSASCTPGRKTYSAFWVGLGGFSLSSGSLEQIGTELDCRAFGAVRSTAWYELVPAGSRAVHIPVSPGDRITAEVAVSGHTVRLALQDRTSGQSFHKKLHAPTVDVSSAEWIAEAPSICVDASQCQTLPLADFGSANFNFARARSTSGHGGTISDRKWGWTKLRLLPGAGRFVTAQGGGNGAVATATSLGRRGSRFSVRYSQVAVGGPQVFRAPQASIRNGYLIH